MCSLLMKCFNLLSILPPGELMACQLTHCRRAAKFKDFLTIEIKKVDTSIPSFDQQLQDC